MKVLHAASFLQPPPGVVNQMNWESEAAVDVGLAWDVKVFCPVSESVPANLHVQCDLDMPLSGGSLPVRARRWLTLKKKYFKWLENVHDEYDALVLRYSTHDLYQLAFLRRCRVPVYTVHHAIEVAELAAGGGVTSSLRSGLEEIIGERCLQNVAGVVGVTDEIVDHEVERMKGHTPATYVYPNGILDTNQVAADSRTEVPEFLFVASTFSHWHGLDLLLDSLEKNDRQFILHLVGNLAPRDKARAQRDYRVLVHGLLGQSEISALTARCWVGLTSFGLHRNNMNQACTLKVREYLAMGMPVYGGYREMLPPDFPFYQEGAADFESILDFAHRRGRSPRTEVAAAARVFIDKRTLLSQLHAWLLHDINPKE